MPAGEDARDREGVQRLLRFNSSIPLNFPESSPTYGEQNNNNSDNAIDSTTLNNVESNGSMLQPPPPPPAFFMGYTLPPGNPCESFTLPPPPADKKRIGPRRKYSWSS